MTAPFEAGDKLLLYTDGILEASGPDGEEFRLENLERLLVETQTLEPVEMMGELFRRISTPLQQDDLTAVLLQFDGVR